MSSIRLIIALLAVSGSAAQAMAARAAPATEAACPAAAQGKPLSSITVYDGPPAENASLVPDATRTAKGSEVSTWRIAGIYRAGRIAYLSCDYGGAKTVVVPVRKAATCTYTESGKAKSLSCR